MKKILRLVLLMFLLVGVVYGANEKLEVKNGKYSGSASMGLVATGTIIERIPQSMLVLKAQDENGKNCDVINFDYKGVKANEERKGKFVAQIYREDENGKMKLVDFDKIIKTEIVTEDKNDKVLKTLSGNEIGKISYELGKSQKLKNKYEGEVINKIVINGDTKGVFIDNKSSLKVVVEDITMAY